MKARIRHEVWSISGFAAALAVALLAMRSSGHSAAIAPGARGGTVYHDATAAPGLSAPIQPTGAAIKRSIIGPDNRTRVPDTADFPFSAIAYLELYDDAQNLIGTCTGTFVGPDVLLTAGHCLYDAGTQLFTRHIRVVPAKDGAVEPFGSEYASDWWVPDNYIASRGNDLFDWGEIRLPDDALALQTGWMQIGVLQTASLSDPQFTPAIVGYPADKPAASMWGASVAAFADVQPRYLDYSIDTSPGQSGSAIWSLNPNKPYFGFVAGIHTSGASAAGENRGTRIDEALLGDLLQGCQQMHCTLAYAVEPVTGTPAADITPAPGGRPFRAVAGDVGRD